MPVAASVVRSADSSQLSRASRCTPPRPPVANTRMPAWRGQMGRRGDRRGRRAAAGDHRREVAHARLREAAAERHRLQRGVVEADPRLAVDDRDRGRHGALGAHRRPPARAPPRGCARAAARGRSACSRAPPRASPRRARRPPRGRSGAVWLMARDRSLDPPPGLSIRLVPVECHALQALRCATLGANAVDEVPSGPRTRRRDTLLVAGQSLLLAGAVVGGRVWHGRGRLAAAGACSSRCSALALVGQFLSVRTGTVQIGPAFIATALAMALLGPAPAAVIAVAAVLAWSIEGPHARGRSSSTTSSR